MISFKDIVQIFDLPVHKVSRTFAFVLQLRDGNAVARRFVGVDHVWLFPVLQAIQGLTEKVLGRFSIARRG